MSHWSPTELATEAVKRGIVEKKISPRSIGRFLKRSDLKGHEPLAVEELNNAQPITNNQQPTTN